MRAWCAAAVVAAALLTLPASAGAAPYAPIPTCSPGPANCPSWHTADVAISWQYEPGWTQISCDSRPVTSDTAGEQRTCSVSYGPDDVYSRTITVRRDTTPPQVTAAAPARAPDAGGWYNRPLTVSFSGSDAMSGLASCTSPTYGGGDGASVTVVGTCTDVAGNTSAPAGFALRYDATPPSVSASADRAPDGKGWYRRPVTVSFAGTDATSGLAACTEAARYAGPDAPSVEVAGTCRDVAGNVAPEAKLALRYDATAPKLVTARAAIAGAGARVTWKRPSDAAAIEIVRTPGVNGRRSTIVYQGTGESFLDKTARTGARYRYEIRAIDAAGNTARLAVMAGRAPLYLPAAGAKVRAPVVLAWSAVAGARFYNVQLYRGAKKVLTAWPRGPRLRVPRTWVYAGTSQRLQPGVYRWYVWPARGTRERPAYGRTLGSSTFRITR